MGRRRSTGKDRVGNDAYVTPAWCVEGFARAAEETLPTPDWVVDLGAGDGRIGIGVRQQMLCWADNIEHVPHPRLMLVDVEQGWESGQLFGQDQPFVSSLEDCGDQVDRVLDESRVLYVSNPPFSLAFEWVRRAVGAVKGRHAPGSCAVFLLRADWLATKQRSDFMESYPPDRMDLLVPRPSFTGGGTDAREYMFAWWRHGAYRGTEVRIMRKGGSRGSAD